MALDDAVIYATYEDDGSTGPGSQIMSRMEPKKCLLIFPNWGVAKEYDTLLRGGSMSDRRNPRLTAFYSEDADEILLSCYSVRRITPLKIHVG